MSGLCRPTLAILLLVLLCGRVDSAFADEQVLQLVREGVVLAIAGKRVPLAADTICLHGDGVRAVEFAQRPRQTLGSGGIDIERVSAH